MANEERKDHTVWVWHGDTQISEVIRQDKVISVSNED
jgi:hypothetical protein